MNLPSFEEFEKQFSEEMIKKICPDKLPSNIDNPTDFAAQIVAESSGVTLVMLKLYHQWLSTSFE